MDNIRSLNIDQPALNVIEQKTGKLRKIVVNQTALDVMQRRLAEYPEFPLCHRLQNIDNEKVPDSS